MNTIGTNIAELRRKHNMTQETLGEMIGISAQSVSKWENGATMPDITLLPILADIFNTTIDALFGAGDLAQTVVPTEELPPRAFDALLKLSASAMHFERDVMKKYRDVVSADNPRASAVYTENNGAFFANQNIGLIYRHTPQESVPLLENENAVRLLSLLTDPDVRIVLHYFASTSHPSTVGTLCAKCSISKEKTESALEKLRVFGLLARETVTLEDGDLIVWKKHRFHLMLHLYAILTLADFAAKGNDCYFGYYGDRAWC